MSKPHDRPAPSGNPGGMECERCDVIFVGEEWHTLCAVCVAITADEIAAQQTPAPTDPAPAAGESAWIDRLRAARDSFARWQRGIQDDGPSGAARWTALYQVIDEALAPVRAPEDAK